jgi:S1-C subfamily serine protease
MNLRKVVQNLLIAGVAVFCTTVVGHADEASTQEKLKRYGRIHKAFSTTKGKRYKTEAIQNVTANGISVTTDNGITRIKPADMPDDFRKLFEFTDEVLAKAAEVYARKRYDSKKAAARQKKVKKSVDALGQKYEMTVKAPNEFGHFCLAIPIGEVTESVKVDVKPRALNRDQEIKTRVKKVKREKAIGQEQLMLVGGLPRSLKPGGKWKGKAWAIGVYTYEIEREVKGTGTIYEDIPLAFVKVTDAVRYRAEIPPDGSYGNSAATGVVIASSRRNSHILTSYRLVATADRVEIEVQGQEKPIPATVVAKDAKEALAVLRVQKSLKPLPFSRLSNVDVGDPIFTIGYPDIDIRDYASQRIEGFVGATKGVRDDSRYLQIDGEFQPGTFGGAVLDGTGTIVGIIAPNPAESFFLNEDGKRYEPLQYAVKSTRFKNVLREIKGFKLPEVSLPTDVDAATKEASVLVRAYRDKK